MQNATQGWEGGPSATVSRGGPDDHKVERPTVSRYAFNGRDHGPLYGCTSVGARIVFTY
jgi:hypothetical protein